MTTMSDLSYSLAMRDIIQKMVADEIETQRPKYRYARVSSIDRANYKCNVIYNGETGAVTVNMGAVQPAAVNQIVRVEGIGIDKFITDVIGGNTWVGDPTGTLSPLLLRVTSTGDAGGTEQYPGGTGSTNHGFQIGPDNGANFRADQNELMCLNNGTMVNMLLNMPVSNTIQGTGGSALTRKDYVDARFSAQWLRNTTSTALANTTWTKVTASSSGLYQRQDGLTFASSTATIATAGWYLVWGNVIWAGNATGRRLAAVYQNGAMITATQAITLPAGSASGPNTPTPPYMVNCAAGDTFELYAYQDSGATLAIIGASFTIMGN